MSLVCRLPVGGRRQGRRGQARKPAPITAPGPTAQCRVVVLAGLLAHGSSASARLPNAETPVGMGFDLPLTVAGAASVFHRTSLFTRTETRAPRLQDIDHRDVAPSIYSGPSHVMPPRPARPDRAFCACIFSPKQAGEARLESFS
ncbi:hypothetical protein Ga0080574_TMP3720 [Salipiger abyssi]|uniref:Uncharacterized protein n=1 Tax=Salipiger abyssi TaxID=1250539 RepID=A0A1P8UXD0_9RHOB|nr:hypothetical protein Ga0080574_TMP3720 [Salipiger abyssi]